MEHPVRDLSRRHSPSPRRAHVELTTYDGHDHDHVITPERMRVASSIQ
jgi:hypothetical protein